MSLCIIHAFGFEAFCLRHWPSPSPSVQTMINPSILILHNLLWLPGLEVSTLGMGVGESTPATLSSGGVAVP